MDQLLARDHLLLEEAEVEEGAGDQLLTMTGTGAWMRSSWRPGEVEEDWMEAPVTEDSEEARE